ncbi:MAG: hypothetical protein KatS3mg014_0137 [Actinomycetota bacterium]|nr:MAG: hypothetical protein KatS3mg014_0137 [Actinomycetota bacterium]
MAELPGPYDDLDAPHGGPAAPVPREPAAGALRVLGRGLLRRCPRCGSGDLFVSWLEIREGCPRCGLRLEREEGGFLGAMTINYTATALVWLAVLVVWLVLDLPDVRLAALMGVSLAVAALFPLLFFPFAKTIWCAVDHLVARSAPEPSRPEGRSGPPSRGRGGSR